MGLSVRIARGASLSRKSSGSSFPEVGDVIALNELNCMMWWDTLTSFADVFFIGLFGLICYDFAGTEMLFRLA